jgi:bilirubin oxidase
MQATLALSYSGLAFAQVKPTNRFASEIPKSEAVALANIMEDSPTSAPAARKGGSASPAYTLYSVALPIPPVAQIKQRVKSVNGSVILLY